MRETCVSSEQHPMELNPDCSYLHKKEYTGVWSDEEHVHCVFAAKTCVGEPIFEHFCLEIAEFSGVKIA